MQAMMADVSDFGQQHPASVTLNVNGGRDTSAVRASQISNQDFKTTASSMIERSRLFTQVGIDPADYHLEIFIARLDQPTMGFNMTVTLETNWTLTHIPENKVVWEKAIPTDYTARAGEAFAGVTRLRLANEGAARMNILEALEEIAELDLTPR